MTQEQLTNGQWNQTYLALEDTKHITDRAIAQLEPLRSDPTIEDALRTFKAARARLHGLQQGMLP